VSPEPILPPPETSAPTSPLSVEPEDPSSQPLAADPVESFRWGWYFLSAFIPLAGILIGLFLYDRDSRAARRVGRNSLLTGFILWILLPLALSSLLVVLGAVSALGWISSLMPLQP
jgi:hypothetical protein